jgi:uncharacterized heparinase superfamily protein
MRLSGDRAGLGASLGRLARTVVHLRPLQLAHQVGFRMFAPVRARRMTARLPTPPQREWQGAWDGPAFQERREVAPGLFRLLGVEGRVSGRAGWQAPDREKLWLYNLHYLDDLALPDAAIASAQGELLNRWISDNPPPYGIGWQPYPLSLRIVNMVKWCSRQRLVAPACQESLARQARALRLQVEHHILANHLFANAKALAFAGAFFAGQEADAWLADAAVLLRREVAEQFLADGGHFERSPMYHATLLWDVCDLLALADRTRLEPLLARVAQWEAVVTAGLRWLEAMTHPDGGIGFFNDATLGVAPTLAEVRTYATLLRVPDGDLDHRGARLTTLTASGFASIELGPGSRLLADVGSIGPDYQPGHAHAETLAFELSVNGQRLVVNSGTSTYEPGPTRRFERSTAAHSTVEVGGCDSSEVWGSFRVGRRARVHGLRATEEPGGVELTAAHDGYRSLPGRPIHRRTFHARPGRLVVADEVSPGSLPAVARFHLHPAVEMIDRSTARLPDQTLVKWSAESAAVRLTAGLWRSGFGHAAPNRCIEVDLVDGRQAITLEW